MAGEEYLERAKMQQQMKQLEELKRKVLMEILTKEARERLSNVRIGNPQLAEQVELYLIQAYQQGQIKEPIADHKLRELLVALTPKRETKIRRW
ncbi:MAG: DNA-binding protein [Candidatus Aenigmatarchaeota archaeon]